MKLKIGILTNFHNWKKSYSLTTVVENQLISLVKHGYKPILFVHDNFKDDEEIPEGVEVRKVIPRFHLVDYSGNQPVEEGFDDQVKTARKALEEHLKDIDVAFTHDWIFQGWKLPYNVAMREAQPSLKCRWLHWIHSAPSKRPMGLEYPNDCRYKMMPNSKLVYMNSYDTLKLAEMYDGEIDDVRVVYNPLDYRSSNNLHELTKHLIDNYKLLEADVVDIYPLSMTRAIAGKQLDKVIWVMGKIKEQGKSIRLVVCNAHANAESEKEKIRRLLDYAKECGLEEGEVIFTSLYENPNSNEFYLYKCPYCEYTYGEEQNGEITYKYKEKTFVCDKCKTEIDRDQFRKIDRSPVPKYTYELGVPNRVVTELFRISNVFIFPSISENCPLILLEAALSKNLLVLNKSFGPLRDFLGGEALYFEFGALNMNIDYHGKEEQFFSEIAKIIIGELNKNRPLQAFNIMRQKFNYDYIFRQQLQPLFWEKWE